MKKHIKKILEKSRILKNFRVKNQLMILNYHRIKDPNKKIVFDDGVYGPDWFCARRPGAGRAV